MLVRDFLYTITGTSCNAMQGMATSSNALNYSNAL